MATHKSQPLDTMPKILDSVIEKAHLSKKLLIDQLTKKTGLTDTAVRNWFSKDVRPREFTSGTSTKDCILDCFSELEEKYHTILADEKEALELLYIDKPADITGNSTEDSLNTDLPYSLLGTDAVGFFEDRFPSREVFEMLAAITNHNNDITAGLDAYFLNTPNHHLQQAKARKYFESFVSGNGFPLPGLDLKFWAEAIPLLDHLPKSPQDIPPEVAVAVTDAYINRNSPLAMGCFDIYRILKALIKKQSVLGTDIYGSVAYTTDANRIRRIISARTYPHVPLYIASSIFVNTASDTYSELTIDDFDELLLDEVIYSRSWEYGDHYAASVFQKLENLIYVTAADTLEPAGATEEGEEFIEAVRRITDDAEECKRNKALKSQKDNITVKYISVSTRKAAYGFIAWMESCFGENCYRFDSPLDLFTEKKARKHPFFPVTDDKYKALTNYIKTHQKAIRQVGLYQQIYSRVNRYPDSTG